MSVEPGAIKLERLQKIADVKSDHIVRLADKLDAAEIVGLYSAQIKSMLRNGVKQWDELYIDLFDTDFVKSRIDRHDARVYVRENEHGVVDASVSYEDSTVGSGSGTINAFIHAGFEVDGFTYFSHLVKQPGSASVFNFLANVALMEHKLGVKNIRLSCVENDTVVLSDYYTKMGFKHMKTVNLKDHLAWLERESLFQAEIV